MDTSLTALSPHLQSIWEPYNVTTVPGKTLFGSPPPPPRVVNGSGGAVADMIAQLWAAAEGRTNQYIGWMAANDQTGFNHHVRSDVFLAGPIGQALRRGEKVTLPQCDLYATTIAVVPVDQAIRDLLAKRGETTSAEYALVMRYAGGCVVTGAGGDVLASTPPGGGVTLETGALRHDPVLGDIWYSDAGAECPATGAPSACSEAS